MSGSQDLVVPVSSSARKNLGVLQTELGLEPTQIMEGLIEWMSLQDAATQARILKCIAADAGGIRAANYQEISIPSRPLRSDRASE